MEASSQFIYQNSNEIRICIYSYLSQQQYNNSKMEIEMFLRDDIIELADQIQQSKFNITSYRTSTRKSHQLRQNTQDSSYRGRIDALKCKTQINQTNIIEANRKTEESFKFNCHSEQHKSDIITMSKTLNIGKIQENKRSIAKSNISDRRALSKIRFKKGSKDVDNNDEKPFRINKWKEIEKQANKSQLNDIYLENWLNQILIEYCHEYKFGQTENAALLKLGIDKNSLISKGMNPSYFQRLYKSLFVYSIGFNNLLKQIARDNVNLLKTIWKVYAMLLEYCSEGDFETMIGELERDKERKINSLVTEIESRQRKIDSNEEEMQERMSKILKENKQLSDFSAQLQQRLAHLSQDLSQTEQAYNEEVNLRLIFQNRINQIHSIHKELNIKHSTLHKDHMETLAKCTKLQQKQQLLTENIVKLDVEVAELKNELHRAYKQEKFNKEMIKHFEEVMQKQKQKIKQDNILINDEKQSIKEKEQRSIQLQRQVKNANLVIEMMNSTQAYHMDEYKRILLQNMELRKTNREQLTRLGMQLSEDNIQYNKLSKLNGDLSYYKKQIEKKNEEIERLKQQITQLQATIQEKDVRVQEIQLRQIGEKKTYDQDTKVIAHLKVLYATLEDQITFYKKIYANYDKFKQQKDDQIQELKRQKGKLTDQLFECQHLVLKYESDIKSIKQQQKSSDQAHLRQITKLKIEIAKLNQSQQAAVSNNAALQLERQQLNDRNLLVSNKLKDVLFQKNSINSLYQQNLNLFERQQKYIDQVNKRTSALNLIIQQQEVSIKKLKKQLETHKKQSTATISKLESINDSLQQQVHKLKPYIHPMKYEDVCGRYFSTKQYFEQEIIKYENTLNQKDMEYKILKDQLIKQQQQHSFLKQSHRVDLQKLKNEKEYYKEKNEDLRAKLDQLQTKMRHKQKIEKELKQTKEALTDTADKKYNDMIRQKNQKIDYLYGQIERIEDIHVQKYQEIESQAQKVLTAKEAIISTLQTQLKLLQQKQVALLDENSKLKFDRSQEALRSRKAKSKQNTEEEDKEGPPKREQTEESILQPQMPEKKVSKNESKRAEMGNKLRNAALYYKK